MEGGMDSNVSLCLWQEQESSSWKTEQCEVDL